jgi:uncharacterized protein (DUF1778 family)
MLSDNAKQNKMKYTNEWKRQNVKRISLEVSHDKYNEIKSAADLKGEKVNTYIKNAIDMRLENEKS